MNLEKEEAGTADDSLTAVILASLLHDLGMTIARESHELLSIQLAIPYIDAVLNNLLSENEKMLKTAIRSLAIEGIFGHMATHKIHSLEAGLVLIGDGSDMEKGRARIPTMLSSKTRVRRYSQNFRFCNPKGEDFSGTGKAHQYHCGNDASVGFFSRWKRSSSRKLISAL